MHPAPDAVFSALGLTVLVTELTFAIVLFSRIARLLCPAIMMLCQVGIIFLQNILFLELLLLAAFFATDLVCQRITFWCATAWARLRHWTGAVVGAPAPAASCPGVPSASVSSPWPAAAVAGLIWLLLTCWVWRVERYPLTAMQMFSEVKQPGVIDYYKVFAHYTSGAISRISLTDVLGSEADFRYRNHLQGAFALHTSHIARQYLTVSGVMLNRRAPPENRVTQLEVQHWRWNFQTQPQSATYGQPLDRFIVRLDALLD